MIDKLRGKKYINYCLYFLPVDYMGEIVLDVTNDAIEEEGDDAIL